MMLTIDKIINEYTYLRAWTGGGESFHDTALFNGHGEFCDVYFDACNKKVIQSQVDAYNSFSSTWRGLIPVFEKFILNNLDHFEAINYNKIEKATTTIDVICATQDCQKYDLIVVFGKSYKYLFFFKKEISVRAELKNGDVVSIQRKSAHGTTEENA